MLKKDPYKPQVQKMINGIIKTRQLGPLGAPLQVVDEIDHITKILNYRVSILGISEWHLLKAIFFYKISQSH